ncbi:MAG: hypothetical protein ACRCZF_11100, partial [Gemmataceae bacterium]
VVEPFPGADLGTLVQDIGAMPDFLAAGYIRHAALGMAAAHERNHFHGRIAPPMLVVGPLVLSSRTKPDGSVIYRPAADATVRVQGLGLSRGATGSAAADVQALGRTFFYLLTKTLPAEGSTPALTPHRTDLTAEFVAIVEDMLAGTVDMATIATRLEPFCPAMLSVAPTPTIAPDPATSSIMPEEKLTPLAPVEPEPLTLQSEPEPLTELVENQDQDLAPAPDLAFPQPTAWTVQAIPADGDLTAAPDFAPEAAPPPDVFGSQFDAPMNFATSSSSTEEPRSVPKPRVTTEEQRARTRMLLMVGAGFWLISIPLWFVLMSQSGCFGTDAPADKPVKKNRR